MLIFIKYSDNSLPDARDDQRKYRFKDEAYSEQERSPLRTGGAAPLGTVQDQNRVALGSMVPSSPSGSILGPSAGITGTKSPVFLSMQQARRSRHKDAGAAVQNRISVFLALSVSTAARASVRGGGIRVTSVFAGCL